MSTDPNTLAGLENQAFALMARLHVIIRRQSGRVTDIEYMRIDPVYCRHVLNMAQDMPNEDVAPICEKLQEIYFGADGLFMRAAPKPPLLNRLANGSGQGNPARGVPEARMESESEQAQKEKAIERHHLELNEAVEKGYIGRLR